MNIFGNSNKKWRLVLAVSVVLAVQMAVIFKPAPARAVGAPDVVAALTGKWSKDAIVEGILASSLGALVNGFSYFMRKIAYDTATYIGSGGKGQGALAFQKGAGEYFKEVALDSAASAIEQFGSPFGLDLCKPPDLKLQVFLQVGLRKLYADPLAGGPQPACSWSNFTNNWEKGFEDFDQKAGDFASQMFASSLKIDQSDLGIAFGLVGKVDRINANAQKAADTSRLEGGGFKAVTGLISGNIKTPAQVIAEETKALTGNKQTDLSSQQIAGIYGAGLWQVIPAAAGVFLNTLVSQLTQTILSGGLLPDPSGDGSAATESTGVSSFNEYAGVINNNKAAAENAFNFLFTAVPTQQLTTYPLLEEMSDCSNPDNPGLNNCVVDPGFVAAVKRASTGKPLTIREAMDKKNNLLHADWALVPPSHEYNSDPRKCYNSGYYCYSNIQKLRRARIVPLGFEIAAAKADPDQLQNWTLQKVVEGFYDCDPSGQPTPQKPFCHLIDPDWIIRLPEPRCDAQVYGPKLLSSDNPARRQECVGISTCLLEDDRGQCLGEYGYCLREKNTWRFGGSSCPEQFNTCTTYTNTADNTRVSYLSRTLEFGQCNAQSVGCRVYSTQPKADGSWRSTAEPALKVAEISAGKNSAIYFNNSIKNYTCPASAEGCSALFRVNFNGSKGDTAFVKKAPNTIYDSCYLVTKNNVKKWPETEADIAELAKRPEATLCKPFAPACTQDEAGCEAYTPADGGDTVTGIVGSNLCPAECVGYDTFKQEVPTDKGAFEPEQFPLQFIPSQANSCAPQHEGCSEFTNIDEASAGGEKLEYYSDLAYCEKPNDKNQKTFYSWEGSVNEGYVLRTHNLRPISSDATDRYNTAYMSTYLIPLGDTAMQAQFVAGSPAYVDDSYDAVDGYYGVCNKETYEAAIKNPYGAGTAKPDCRAFYDEAGTVYYRLLSKTIAVSAACHPLRKTESFLRFDQALTTQNQEGLCLAKGGKWTGGENSKCELCYNGGIYNNGACIYWTTSQPGDAKTCPKEANNCRAYTGKAANNVQTILDQKFEPIDNSPTALSDAKAGWDTGAIKPESLTVGQYSLEINADTATYEFPANTLETNKFYELEFWARGTQQNLEISFVNKSNNQAVGVFTFDPVTKQNVKLPVSQTWQAYRVGPVQFTGNGSGTIVLRITRTAVGSSGAYYLDNLRLTKVKDKLFLIKNSWKRSVVDANGNTILADAPLSCDANPTDGLPGAALGCRAYTDSLNNQVPATGFDRLCRAEAVGCTAFFDSQNTPNETDATAFNLWCTGEQNTECTLTVGGTQLGSCTVPAGEVGCFIPQTILSETTFKALTGQGQDAIVKSTVIVPADTPENAPIYLSYRQQFACDAANLGCQKIALEEHVIPNSTAPSAYKFTESYVKNDPAVYDQILCAAEQMGCSAFKANNTVAYFKDPKASGAPICVYKDKAQYKEVSYSGWFQEGVGECSNNSNTCKQDADCGEGGKCENIGSTPCYPNYLISGAQYGIWSNKSPEYNGSVGRCAEQYNQCTELIDPLDTSGGTQPAGKPYYVIFDQKLLQEAGACEGKVNLKQGCALFNYTGNPTKLYNAVETYKISDGLNANGTAKYGPADPVTAGALDTNVLLKVNRDRTCSEWLGCKDKVRVTDQTGKQRTICTQYKACRATEIGSSCTEWSPLSTDNTDILNESKYINRNVSWYGEDYTGYSLFNRYQAGDMVTILFKDDEASYLAYEVNPAILASSKELEDKIGCKKPNWQTCGFDNGGRCYENKCIYPISGSFPEDLSGNAEEIESQAKKLLEAGSCQAFPEQISPFPSTIVKEQRKKEALYNPKTAENQRIEPIKKAPGFEGANICQNGNCSCNYQKVTYKSGTVDYRSVKEQNYPISICSGGDYDGQACKKDADCGLAGVCSQLRDVETHAGLLGFCLERDYSRPIDRQTNEYACLTWLPVDMAASRFDQYNRHPEAGYYPPLDAYDETSQNIYGQIYCTEATGNGLGAYNKDKFTCTFPDIECNPPYEFINNKSEYPFTKHGDYYISDLSQLFSDEKKLIKIDDPKYVDRVYSLMQMWAWRGGMYQKGLASILGKNHGKNIQEYEKIVKDVENYPFLIENASAAVLFTSSMHYLSYLWSSSEVGNAEKKYYKPVVFSNPEVVYNLGYKDSYLLPIKVYESDLDALHFGPVMAPPTMDRVLSIDFNQLASGLKDRQSSGTKLINYKYNVYGKFTGTNGYTFVFKVVIPPDSPSIYAGMTRYVVVALSAGENGDLNKMPTGYDSLNLGNDPLSFFIEYIDEIAGENVGANWKKALQWWEIPGHSSLIVYCDFSSTGEKLGCGYSANYADSYSYLQPFFGFKDKKGFAPPYLAEVAEFKQRCTRFAQVYHPNPGDPAATTNKAWTSRTWKYNIWEYETEGDKTSFSVPLFHNTKLVPHGSTNLSSELVPPNPSSDESWKNTLRKYYFTNVNYDGTYFNCSDFVFDIKGGAFNQDFLLAGLSGALDECTRPKKQGSGYETRTLQNGIPGINYLKEIFRKTFFETTPNLSTLSGKDYTTEPTPDYLHPPKVISLNVDNCFSVSKKANQACGAWKENAITVNRRNGDEDLNKDGLPDPIISESSLMATVNFFGYADDNRMPLKRILIDWGDGNYTNKERYGEYKNHKPFCWNTDVPPKDFKDIKIGHCSKVAQLTCVKDSDCPQNNKCNFSDVFAFGDIKRTCEPSYFEFVHGYSCTQSDALISAPYVYNWGENKNGLDTKLWELLEKSGYSKEKTPFVCIFKPKVQLLDNWGWCTGKCKNYNKDGSTDYKDGCTNFDPLTGAKQCESDPDSFVPYLGNIVVIPK